MLPMKTNGTIASKRFLNVKSSVVVVVDGGRDGGGGACESGNNWKLVNFDHN